MAIINNYFKQIETHVKNIFAINSKDYDPAHDFLHIQRVVNNAIKFCTLEGGTLEIVIPAAYLHDMITISKDHPDRSKASHLSAIAAIEYLKTINYPSIYYDEIFHAIESHSFSANIQPKTIEAKIVQDADRLDAIGAIGIARCFSTSGMLKRELYCNEDPFNVHKYRELNDLKYSLDHFFKKLLNISVTMQTKSGIDESKKRLQTMQQYLLSLQSEIIDS